MDSRRPAAGSERLLEVGNCNIGVSTQCAGYDRGHAPLDLRMPPTVLNRLCCHRVPCSPCHQHSLQKIDLVDVIIASLVTFDGPQAEGASVVSLEAADNACVERLDEWSHIGLKPFKTDIGGYVVDLVSREIIDSQDDLALLQAHLLVTEHDPSGVWSVSFLSLARSSGNSTHSSNNLEVIQDVLLLR